MTDPTTPEAGMRLVPETLVRFLMGEGELDGLSFGDAKPVSGGRHGRFWWRTALRSCAAAPVPPAGDVVAWACKACNSPRPGTGTCWKCGGALKKPADGWDWPGLPDVDRIRTLAKEVGYAVGVHGSLERDLDLIAAPWVADAVTPPELAQHIAEGLGGRVVDDGVQDKPCGRWSCNIHTPDWTKMIDLSVMPAHPAEPAARELSNAVISLIGEEPHPNETRADVHDRTFVSIHTDCGTLRRARAAVAKARGGSA